MSFLPPDIPGRGSEEGIQGWLSNVVNICFADHSGIVRHDQLGHKLPFLFSTKDAHLI